MNKTVRLPKKFGVCLFLVLSGCHTVNPPRIFNPGTTDTQRREAIAFDPYASNDIAPEIEDTRPADFDRPPTEYSQSRRLIRNYRGSEF